MAGLTRAQFLAGKWSGGGQAVVRPPWALPEAAFLERCTRCGDCMAACPTAIVAKGRGGFPRVDFTRGECTFCGACIDACKPRALVRGAGAAPWALVPRIAESCLAARGVVCRSCGDRCEVRAIRFRLARGGVSRPELLPDQCTGCGACVGVCPAGAITMADGVDRGAAAAVPG
jgi:ferredoxin-type protein NapF